MKINYLIKDNNLISLNYNGKNVTLTKSDSNFNRIFECIKRKDFDIIPGILESSSKAIELSRGYTISNGHILVNGEVINSHIEKRVFDYLNEGLDPSRLINFWKNLQQNPLESARERLFLFLENGNHPFTDDGCFIAYKKVRKDFRDVHTGTFDNSPGKIVKMNRNLVDSDPNNTCSRGLHAASWDYAKGYSGDILIEVKINGKNVVSIPTDYNNQKMRVCEYEVLGVCKSARTETHVDEPVKPDLDNSPVDTSKDFDQGYTDGKILYNYFLGIGKTYTYSSFIQLKRFDKVSQLYKDGIKKAYLELNLS